MEIQAVLPPWMDPEDIMLSEASQSQEDTRHVVHLYEAPGGFQFIGQGIELVQWLRRGGGEGVSPGDSFRVQDEEPWRSVRGRAICSAQAATGRRQGLARLDKAGTCAGTLARQRARLPVPGPGSCLHRC